MRRERNNSLRLKLLHKDALASDQTGNSLVTPQHKCQAGYAQHHRRGLRDNRAFMVLLAAVAVHGVVVSGATSERQRHTDWHVRKQECRGEKLGRCRIGAWQIRCLDPGTDRKPRWFEYRDGSVQYVLIRLFVGDVGLGHIGDLVAATCTRGNLAVRQQQFAEMQAHPAVRPENSVANAIGKINLAGFAGPHQMSAAVIESGVMPPHDVIAERRIA